MTAGAFGGCAVNPVDASERIIAAYQDTDIGCRRRSTHAFLRRERPGYEAAAHPIVS